MPEREPLVSCITPTHNRRRDLQLAIRYYLRQDYQNREWIIVDDGSDRIDDLIPPGSNIQYIRCQRRSSVGDKRNLACQQARGEIILHWDDDDWMGANRLRRQVEALLAERADICGLNRVQFLDPLLRKGWEYTYPGKEAWVHGATFAYWRSLWQSSPFPNISVGEDVRWLKLHHTAKILPIQDNKFFIGLVHPKNTSPKQTQDQAWTPIQVDKLWLLMGQDRYYYSGDKD